MGLDEAVEPSGLGSAFSALVSHILMSAPLWTTVARRRRHRSNAAAGSAALAKQRRAAFLGARAAPGPLSLLPTGDCRPVGVVGVAKSPPEPELAAQLRPPASGRCTCK